MTDHTILIARLVSAKKVLDNQGMSNLAKSCGLIAAADALEAQARRIAELEAALREAYEVYAGSDGFIPETAAEGYQQQLIKQMMDVIGAALEKKND